MLRIIVADKNMERKIYNKLVRDRIPEIIKAEGGEPEVRTLDSAEYAKYVRLKLVEEAGEANAAKTREEMVKELSDVLEVMEALMRHEGIRPDEVTELKQKRREERGGFDKRIYLMAG